MKKIFCLLPCKDLLVEIFTMFAGSTDVLW